MQDNILVVESVGENIINRVGANADLRDAAASACRAWVSFIALIAFGAFGASSRDV